MNHRLKSFLGLPLKATIFFPEKGRGSQNQPLEIGLILPLDQRNEVQTDSVPQIIPLPYPASAFAFIRQAIWVMAGTLEFAEGAQLHRLRPGDCLELGPAADCVFANRGRTPCRYLVAVVRR